MRREAPDEAEQDGPNRMCAVTRDVRPIGDLIRFVVGPGDVIVPDIRRRLPDAACG